LDRAVFIRRNTVIATPPLVPEIRLHFATDITPIWQATEETLARAGVPPPFWAFAWTGGQALARFILDHPGEIAGRAVLDFGAGSGLVAIAAAKAGAARVLAAEIDYFGVAPIAANAELNGVGIAVTSADLLDTVDLSWEVVTAGDICYERAMAVRVTPWLAALAARGSLVLLGDPGRAYLPSTGMIERARYIVATSRELEDRDTRDAVVWQVLPGSEVSQSRAETNRRGPALPYTHPVPVASGSCLPARHADRDRRSPALRRHGTAF
jgi:predicted nicotinamide N-methyase